jgi:hypothetical protein
VATHGGERAGCPREEVEDEEPLPPLEAQPQEGHQIPVADFAQSLDFCKPRPLLDEVSSRPLLQPFDRNNRAVAERGPVDDPKRTLSKYTSVAEITGGDLELL